MAAHVEVRPAPRALDVPPGTRVGECPFPRTRELTTLRGSDEGTPWAASSRGVA